MRLLVVAGAFFFVASLLPKPEFKLKPEYIAPPPLLNHFLFGQHYLIADLFWIRALQDLDYCEQRDSLNQCQGKTWLSQILLFITQIDPYYRMVYSAGASSLSIIISDINGASQLWNRALLYYPMDWHIVYRAAYHALFEEKNTFKAARLMEQSARSGAPDWVFALATRLYTREGQIEFAERLLNQSDQFNLDPKIQDLMRQRIQEKLAQ